MRTYLQRLLNTIFNALILLFTAVLLSFRFKRHPENDPFRVFYSLSSNFRPLQNYTFLNVARLDCRPQTLPRARLWSAPGMSTLVLRFGGLGWFVAIRWMMRLIRDYSYSPLYSIQTKEDESIKVCRPLEQYIIIRRAILDCKSVPTCRLYLIFNIRRLEVFVKVPSGILRLCFVII
jgi:hypothetical protein